MSALQDWELRIMEFEERLRSIAKRTADVTDPRWFERMQAAGHPLDEAGIRRDVEKLLNELIAGYAERDDETRIVLRRLFVQYPSFAWAAMLAEPKTTTNGLRQHLILFSMQDQGRDSRDALLELQALISEAARAGVPTVSLIREVAAISSSIDKYGMGSTRDMLLRCVQLHDK
jgi:hypothetical protein